MALLEIAGVVQQFGERRVLSDINLKIERGEVFVLIGPTGAGKTTLLRLINLLDQPASGNIHFGGMDVTRSKRDQLEARRCMSCVHQKPVVFTMSVFDNVACGLKWRHEGNTDIKPKVEAALEMVDMRRYRDRNARTLSGGETQRIAIARALVTGPELLLLDEPTANLDPLSASKTEAILERIINERRTTILMTTHDLSQGQRLGSRIGVLIDGRILQTGTPAEVFGSPQNREVAEFVGINNIFAGVVTGKENGLSTITLDGSSATLQSVSDFAMGEKVYAMISPDDITLSLLREPSSARNMYRGKVSELVPAGPLTRIKVDCGFPLRALVTRKSAEEMGLAAGREVHVSFKATAVRIIKQHE
ncbi:MAG: ABC transporter ATP-binding protein [Chloroflexi bacterium]|nr:ABC transporter ATP-binding protein [Chloroflexota bacterium]